MLEDAGYGTDDEQKEQVVVYPIARRKSNHYDLPPNHPAAMGINQDALARMSHRSDHDEGEVEDDDEDDDPTHSFGYNQYQYGGNTNKTKRRNSTASCSKQTRRNSTSSRSSRQSARRRSTASHLQSERDPLKGLFPNKNPEDSSEDESDGPSDMNLLNSFGYESDAGKSISAQSISSSRARRSRRNSNLPAAERMLCSGDESKIFNTEVDEEEEDSLLNRARTGIAKKIATSKKVQMDNEASCEEDNALLYDSIQPVPVIAAPSPLMVPTLAKNEEKTLLPPVSTKQENQSVPQQDENESWMRKDPLTTSYAPPTIETLQARSIQVAIDPFKLSKAKSGLGALHIDAGKEEDILSHDSFSNDSMFSDAFHKNPTFQELDQYKQKARRRDSIDATCITIQAEKTFNFKPADGCNNASDFLVRSFAARLRISGFTVLKHNRSRWSKAKHRVIYLLPDGKTLTWREEDSDDENKNNSNDEDDSKKAISKIRNSKRSKKDHFPRIDLTTVQEVRHAWSPDPNVRSKRGTAVLRNRCKESTLAGKSFSLIFAKRTLDLTAFSNDQCKILIEGFSALCFRLKQLKHEHDHSNGPASMRGELEDDDWAVSTIFGGSESITTPTLTATTTNSRPKVNSPWGF